MQQEIRLLSECFLRIFIINDYSEFCQLDYKMLSGFSASLLFKFHQLLLVNNIVPVSRSLDGHIGGQLKSAATSHCFNNVG